MTGQDNELATIFIKVVWALWRNALSLWDLPLWNLKPTPLHHQNDHKYWHKTAFFYSWEILILSARGLARSRFIRPACLSTPQLSSSGELLPTGDSEFCSWLTGALLLKSWVIISGVFLFWLKIQTQLKPKFPKTSLRWAGSGAGCLLDISYTKHRQKPKHWH